MYMDSEGQTPAFLDFRKRYSARYGEEASFASVYGYDALMVMAKALGASRSLDGPSIKASILGIGTFQGLQEEIRLDRFGDCDKRPMVFAASGGSFHRLP
jgi:branched-chain amino acid transport system substrate-binding protein